MNLLTIKPKQKGAIVMFVASYNILDSQIVYIYPTHFIH